jgi:hypothetical protein
MHVDTPNAGPVLGLRGALGDVGPHDDLSYTGEASSDSKVGDLALFLSIISSIVLMLKD